MGRSEVHEAARALARILEAEGVPYAIDGALALGAHGRSRLTDDVGVSFAARISQPSRNAGWVAVT
jgi:hypothetical protein